VRITSYNAATAIEYARRWALGRNPAYYSFNGIGGDCTNFISQCLYAGARVMNYTPVFGWYYRSANDRTPSWTGVDFLFDFLTHNTSIGPFGHVVFENFVQLGDIVQLSDSTGDYYHSLLIISTSPKIRVAAHSDDAFNRLLSDYRFEGSRFIHIDGVRKW